MILTIEFSGLMSTLAKKLFEPESTEVKKENN